jgi:hypothetical protein
MGAAGAVGPVPAGLTTGTYEADALEFARAKVVIATKVVITTRESYPNLLH